jgi:hypothetical protein
MIPQIGIIFPLIVPPTVVLAHPLGSVTETLDNLVIIRADVRVDADKILDRAFIGFGSMDELTSKEE